MHENTKQYVNGIKTSFIFSFLMTFCVSALWGQDGTDPIEEGLSSKFTSNFSPLYKEYTAADTTRTASVRFKHFKGKKLVFYDDFKDNRSTWPHWSSSGDSMLRECIGLDKNYICKGEIGHLTDAYTNMEDGKKLVACFTPDAMFKYSSNIRLTKNVVVTFNPLSIKKVDKLPSTYYEGFAEHTTRIHQSFDKKDFVIETRVDQCAGSWGVIFGDFDSERPYYYFKVQTDNTWSFYAVYPNSKQEPIELESGYMPVSYLSLEKVGIHLRENGQGGFKVEFWINDARGGGANVTRMPMKALDIGYRLDHNSIDGNNILIAQDLSVYEMAVETYLEDNLKVTGGWHGYLKRGKETIYNVKLNFSEDYSGNISGRIFLSHSKFQDIKITKRFRASREKNIINYEDVTGSIYGIRNKVLKHSILTKGNMELIGPDSIVMSACLASNLHKYGEYDSRLNIHSDQIYLQRIKKTETTRISGHDSINTNRLIEIKDIYFLPNSPELSKNASTKQSLDNLARELQRYLANNDNRLLLIHGHTDIGWDQVLSLIRAHSIEGELRKRGVDADIFCIGHGNSMRASAIRGDSRNRRVELEVLALDSCEVSNESLFLRSGTRADLIKRLPDEYVINVQFRLKAEGEYSVIMGPRLRGEPLIWPIPNIAGGEGQALKIVKRYRAKDDAIMLEFWLDDVNVLKQNITSYSSFGLHVKSGELILDNLVISGPED